jgi:hypothetical protein
MSTGMIFLEQSLPALLEDVPLHVRRKLWFMHDGAPAHFSMYAREYLNAVFPARWFFSGLLAHPT